MENRHLTFLSLSQDALAAEQLAKQIIDLHHLSGPLTRITEGSQIIFEVNESLVLKIFNPDDELFFQNEVLFLKQLSGKLPIPTPECIISGQEGPFPYLIMQKMMGVPLNTVWESLPLQHQSELMVQLGQLTRCLHNLPTALFNNTSHPWQVLFQSQKDNLIHNHAGYGVTAPQLKQIRNWINFETLDGLNPKEIVPLHTELMLEHIFVTNADNNWKVCGLIDFEPAMLGHREYDFAAVGVFICPGQPHLFRQFLQGYGYQPGALTAQFSRRIMSWLLLHRYCNLTWFRAALPKNQDLNSLEDLQNFWFGV